VADERTDRCDLPESAPRKARARGLRWVVAAIAASKLAALGLSWLGGAVPDGSTPPAVAAESPESSGAPVLAVKPPPATAVVADEASTTSDRKERASAADLKSMLEELARRQGELDQREKAVTAREQKLALYEKDVTDKIAQLEQVGKTLKEELRKSNAVSDEAAASLAKVYGAMKPAEAAPILDQLDEATALRILTRMKEKQVGEILPLMTRDRAIVLTRSLASRAMPTTAIPKS
jgi:flagellar motility protein MotE (MotC chaperone)